jgi:hypothetical protein
MMARSNVANDSASHETRSIYSLCCFCEIVAKVSEQTWLASLGPAAAAALTANTTCGHAGASLALSIGNFL